MNPELVILALVSTFKIASLAAIYALMQRDAPARLLVAYIVAGFAFVFLVGGLIVLALHGVEVTHPGGLRRVAEIVAGAALLMLAIAAFAGRLPTDAPGEMRTAAWARNLDGRVGMRAAAVAGVLTHLPGVFYLVALDLIISRHPGNAVFGLKETAVFDLLWFTLPLAALIAVRYRPEWARDRVEWTRAFATRHAPQLIGVISALLGTILLVDALTR